MARIRKPKAKRRPAEDRQLTTRVVRRSPVDMGKLTSAFVGLDQARAEKEAQAQHQRVTEGDTNELA